MDIGADLRKARIARKRSIEDIARATKISSSMLCAIENDDFTRVPGGLFTRGYLRAFAREVGLDPEDIVQRYRAEHEPPPTESTETVSDSTPVAASARPLNPDDEPAQAKRNQLIEYGIILLIIAVSFALMRQGERSSAVQQPDLPAAAAPPPATDAPVATSGNDAAPSELKVEIRPKGPCWVEAVADGEREMAKLMASGDLQTVTVRDTLTLRVGDPATFAFSIDGVPGRSFGRPGHPESIHITRATYKTFLESRQ